MPYFEVRRPGALPVLAAPTPQAGVIFLHGFGEHSGLYERLARRAQRARIDLWAIDEIGHGLSDGERGIVWLDRRARGERPAPDRDRAADQRPGLPVVLAGHSLGGVTAAVAVARNPAPYSGVVLSGTPIDAHPPGRCRRWRR